MTLDMTEQLRPFREEAHAQGVPAEDVERWMGLARPVAGLTRDGDGPVAAQLGGPLLLPPDDPAPEYPYVGSVDCAALPEGATDLPLPPDGRILLFGYPDLKGFGGGGEVRYVPAGTAVEERDGIPERRRTNTDSDQWRICQAFPRTPLRLETMALPPHHYLAWAGGDIVSVWLPEHPYAEELHDAWDETGITAPGPLQIGGYAWNECTDVDPVVEAAELDKRAGGERPPEEDWVLLALWNAGADIEGREGCIVYWCMTRQDLAARRFDRAQISTFWNP